MMPGGYRGIRCSGSSQTSAPQEPVSASCRPAGRRPHNRAASMAGYQMRSRKLPSSIGPPAGAVNSSPGQRVTVSGRGSPILGHAQFLAFVVRRPFISFSMPPRICAGIGTTRWERLLSGILAQPVPGHDMGDVDVGAGQVDSEGV